MASFSACVGRVRRVGLGGGGVVVVGGVGGVGSVGWEECTSRPSGCNCWDPFESRASEEFFERRCVSEA